MLTRILPVAIMAMALSACGSEQASSDQVAGVAQSAPSEPAHAAEPIAARPSIDANDKADLEKYGACSFASRTIAIFASTEKGNGNKDPRIDLTISTFKHQYAVYRVHGLIIVDKYPKSDLSELNTYFDKFENTYKGELTSSDPSRVKAAYDAVNQYRMDNCKMTADMGRKALNEYREYYDAAVDILSSL
jgi:hypothetical protein